MHNIRWVYTNDPLPDPNSTHCGDVIAVGLDLSVERLNDAYSKGIFPWFNAGEPVLWWCPDPRMVLSCDNLRVSKSMAKLLRRINSTETDENPEYMVTTNMCFSSVISACAQPTPSRPKTWINKSILATYTEWHNMGHAHSIEVWNQGKLVGGLYGVLLGRFFFGESMFSRRSNMSKVALCYLVAILKKLNVYHIDCQQHTDHLYSMGARSIPREYFLDMLKSAQQYDTPVWLSGQLLQSGNIRPMQTLPEHL